MKNGVTTRSCLIAVLLTLPVALAGTAALEAAVLHPADPGWLGPDGKPLPFRSHEEAEEFLLEARILSKETIGKGINHPQKLLLERDGIRAHAIFRDVAVERKGARFRNGDYQHHFRDSAMFEVAAYRLARLLELEGFPPTVKRNLGWREGTVQLWIESAVDERERIQQGVKPADVSRWRVQMQNLRFFDNLIANSDRNQGNILLDSAGRLWMIDHTRTFQRDSKLMSPSSFWQLEGRVWRRLVELDESTLRRELRPYLGPAELDALWTRRNLLVEKFERLIQERGESLVLLEIARLPALRAGL